MIFCFRYCAALLYDALILIAVFFGFTLMCVGFLGRAISSGTTWYQCSLVALLLGYYLFSYGWGGQTIGQKAWQVQLIFLNNASNLQQIFLRLILYIPALILSLFIIKNPFFILQKATKTKLCIIKN